ncbi:2-oxo-4-hydroxy-4-carboxy-5-ureidoimidazoline decarboxylase [Paenibacillus urinalis]|uniref:2-oxo-4-hydroxy-4-carboxy-5-ureidoimidazoline decarboxylase n=1 Tax=Paenibacillus urinalis TaxID=521520 RepID=A0AAX3N681_9BACL|nr:MULTISPECIES: 2-oxo-4-hydroxy-4-carboxy-5-ureidoimidazoline decarboxylase [Paenibacillus]WDH85152.1 2-oxo-4-hydroxy-4-carboxy-5-ureidoimidazoline decarboxylase [Paenibacillus urinalis]WDI00078.1 2-oxo-4-hydroxy-4-carboxy-5-ureidoimidazoline decarboxylase [Paenibacillus urinalis]WDI04905.1 2-oxo-4-hydroxy-4-carboxy-5-ureidoimidazoline decarboxylase [Paenibacillus urinalis]
MDDVNSYSKEQFTEAFGTLFEHSSWVAEEAYSKKPFTSMAQLHEQMKSVVESADTERKLILLREHPDLGARIAMSSHSVQEQAGAGLQALSEVQHSVLSELNRKYTQTFKFPFIIAVKGKSSDEIIAAIKERVHHSYETEFETALREVYRISWYRLEAWMLEHMEEER